MGAKNPPVLFVIIGEVGVWIYNLTRPRGLENDPGTNN